MIIKPDCFYFKGDVPCIPHKKEGVICEDCNYYKSPGPKILIIKLGAIGDVIRTTPLLWKLDEELPTAHISWLTYSPEVLSDEFVDQKLPVNIENIEYIKNVQYDWLINLDKDKLAISLTNIIKARKKSGFTIDENGKAKIIGTEAERHKWLTGLFDSVNKENTKNYMEEIFEICGYKFSGEEYILPIPKSELNFSIDKTKIKVGLNTGCGGRWSSRLWPTEYWIQLSQDLILNHFQVILLGGEQEHQKNREIAEKSGADYFGHFPLNDFINLMDKCDIIVSSVTMGMHLALGLKKQLILFNNIFNKNEFYLYNRGSILEPDFECNCYFSPTCSNNCMQYIKPEVVLDKIKFIKF